MVEWGLLARGEDPRLEGESAALRKLFEKEWLANQDQQADNNKSAVGVKNS
jgi:cytochrome c biogenesis protein